MIASSAAGVAIRVKTKRSIELWGLMRTSTGERRDSWLAIKAGRYSSEATQNTRAMICSTRNQSIRSQLLSSHESVNLAGKRGWGDDLELFNASLKRRTTGVGGWCQ